mmetsp:Transcript_39648/g.78924  ORF Transcript_39648/g.78924 Transcript_39648/m.78924 type:complete len:726 (+) Transcript_39648:112-2289(+)
MNQDDKKNMRVIIIGAGASGIGAARTLSAAGAEVIVLEGRDRIGGRMKKHSLTKNLIPSSCIGAEHYVNIQLGANWIHGMEPSNPMFMVAQKLKLELHQTSSDDEPGDDVILFDSGDCSVSELSGSDKIAKVAFGRVSKEDYHESLSRYEWIKEYVDHISVNYDKEDISLQAAFDLALKASESEIFGPCPEAQKRCLTWMYDRVSIDLGALSSKVSLNCYAEGVSDGSGGEGLVKHVGYSYILQHLAEEFPLDIRLNHPVSKISVMNAVTDRVFEHPGISTFSEQELIRLEAGGELHRCALKDGRCVSIECSNGETFVADACIVTVPMGALQAEAIKFSPRPPSVITSVCSSLKMGLMNLVWLWYPEVFWPEECNFLGVARSAAAGGVDAEEDVVKFSTFLIPPIYDNFGVRQPVLMCQIVGPYATTIESMSDADIATEATATLRAMFGDSVTVPDAIGCAHSEWGSDPFSRGSWSYFPYRADNSSFSAGSVTSAETDGRGVYYPGSAIVDAARDSEGVRGVEDNNDSRSSSSTGIINSGRRGVMAEMKEGAGCLVSDLMSVRSVSPVKEASSVALRIPTVTFADEDLATAYPLHRSVSISEAASSMLDSMDLPSAGVAASTATSSQDYSDLGCTSDGTDSSSSDDESDSEDESASMGGATTSCASASSSDESNGKNAARSEDEVISLHLYYASEAMSVQNRGTVHGAYKSGIREANKILAFLDK